MRVLSERSVSGGSGACRHRVLSGYGVFNPYRGKYVHGWTRCAPFVRVPKQSIDLVALHARIMSEGN